MRRRRRHVPVQVLSAFDGFRFPPEVIMLSVRWYLRYNLSYRDVEELLAERNIDVDHVTLYRWVQRFTPLVFDAARPCRHQTGNRWFVDETYVKVAGVWRYVYRAVDQHGQVIDVFVSQKTRHRSGTTILHWSSFREPGTGRGGDRQGSGVSERDRRLVADRVS